MLRYAQTECGCSEEDQVAGIHTPDLPVDVEWLMTCGPQGRLATVTDPYGFTETYSYEPSGELHSVRDRLDRLTTIDHDQLGRVLGVLDHAGRKQGHSYPAPSAGTWTGPSAMAASADATDAATSLSDALRSGDYQLGTNAFDIEGYPARISFYRDPTFELAYTHFFDNAGRHLDRFGDAPDLRRAGLVVAAASLVRRPNEPARPRRDHEPAPRRLRGRELLARSPARHDPSRRLRSRRVTGSTSYFSTSGVASPSVSFYSYGSEYGYRPDGRLSFVANADGSQTQWDTAAGAVTISAGHDDFIAVG